MIELGELEKAHAEFDRRKVQVIAISNDDVETTKLTQDDFPHLKLVSDVDQNMAKAVEVIHEGAGAKGEDTNAPTTFLVEGDGRVSWYRRTGSFLARLSPEEVLAAIDEERR